MANKPIPIELKDAIIQDAILEKFRGDKSFSFEETHLESFFKSIHANFSEVENNFKPLFAENYLVKRSPENTKIHLADKGFHAISNLSVYGRVALYEKQVENNKIIYRNYYLAILTAGITILTFVLALKECSSNKDQINQNKNIDSGYNQRQASPTTR